MTHLLATRKSVYVLSKIMKCFVWGTKTFELSVLIVLFSNVCLSITKMCIHVHLFSAQCNLKTESISVPILYELSK